jgi:hypothetical protein
MKTPRFLHYLILLLAVWLPLDNAVAGAVIADCPMMSHAFEEGLQATLDPATANHNVMAAMHGMTSLPQQTTLSDQANGCCNHCAVCLLLGSAAISSMHTAPTFFTYPASYQAAAQTQAPVGIVTHPFRPPII